MKTSIQVLSVEECSQVHEQTLNVLWKTGIRVDTAQGRQILKDAGAEVNEGNKIVRFPKSLIEESLRQAPKDFILGARRPGWNLQMNGGGCTLCPDGGGTMVFDRDTGERRPATFEDWKNAIVICDAIDEFGILWSMVEPSEYRDTLQGYIDNAIQTFSYFSKHVQFGVSDPKESPWLFEILQTIFGSREIIQKIHPVSCTLCPQSPLIIEQKYTDAYLSLKGYKIPVVVMPMPLMGATSPGSMMSTLVQGNAETLAMLCLLQAHEPGVPVIYAPAMAKMDPRTGNLGGLGIEMCIAAIEMSRFYKLPVMGTGYGSDAPVPGIQWSYETALNALPIILSWPDILVGPGMLQGSMVMSYEQIVMDVEIFRQSKKFHQGIAFSEEKWLTDVIDKVGPGGNFLCEKSTLSSVRGEEWYLSDLGVHGTYENWIASGKKKLHEEAREKVDHILATHEPLPLEEDVVKELAKIQDRGRKAD